MRRIYRQVEIRHAEDGWQVELDGTPARYADGDAVAPQLRPLAAALAEEWRAQGEKIDPAAMPLLRLSQQLDRLGQDRQQRQDELLGYARTELLCYREQPETELGHRQQEQWEPWLTWAETRYHVLFMRTPGVMPVVQPAETLQQLDRALHELDPVAFTALCALTKGLGSLLLGLAVTERRLSAEAAVPLSRLEAAHQEKRWGQDEETALSVDRLRKEMQAAERFLTLGCG